MNIEINANIPIEWGREYYTVEKSVKEVRSCKCCDDTGKVTIKGKVYECPDCRGSWRNKDIVAEKKVYSVGKWEIHNIIVENLSGKTQYTKITFRRLNDAHETITYVYCDKDGSIKLDRLSMSKEIYEDYNVALAEVKRLNAEEKERLKKEETE